jgi:hypothetical protein
MTIEQHFFENALVYFELCQFRQLLEAYQCLVPPQFRARAVNRAETEDASNNLRRAIPLRSGHGRGRSIEVRGAEMHSGSGAKLEGNDLEEAIS